MMKHTLLVAILMRTKAILTIIQVEGKEFYIPIVLLIFMQAQTGKIITKRNCK